MKLAQFKTKNSDQQRLGILIGDAICDVIELARAVQSAGGNPASWLVEVNSSLDIIQRGSSAVEEINTLLDGSLSASRPAQTVAYALDSIDFLPAVYPSKILAIGRNYAEHAAEGGADLPKAPLLFNKLPNALSAHNAPIVLPTISAKVDYLVSYPSQGITLEPGDVIASGTPDGVGIFRKPPVLLKPGDVFEVKIEKLGVLRNPVVAAKN